MNKIAYSVIFCFMLIITFVLPVGAETVNLYANIDDSSSQSNLLIDAMRSDQAYDPFYEYVVLRSGEYEYTCYFAPDLSKSNIVKLTFVPSRSGLPASLSRSTVSSLTINKHGYYYVGNVPGALSSAQAESYKLGAIVTMAAIAIIVLILFKIFRKSEGRKTKYYSVR